MDKIEYRWVGYTANRCEVCGGAAHGTTFWDISSGHWCNAHHQEFLSGDRSWWPLIRLAQEADNDNPEIP